MRSRHSNKISEAIPLLSQQFSLYVFIQFLTSADNNFSQPRLPTQLRQTVQTTKQFVACQCFRLRAAAPCLPPKPRPSRIQLTWRRKMTLTARKLLAIARKSSSTATTPYIFIKAQGNGRNNPSALSAVLASCCCHRMTVVIQLNMMGHDLYGALGRFMLFNLMITYIYCRIIWLINSLNPHVITQILFFLLNATWKNNPLVWAMVFLYKCMNYYAGCGSSQLFLNLMTVTLMQVKKQTCPLN